MAKSKREKIVHLTKVTKKGKEAKNALIEQIRQALDNYEYIYLFSVENMRNCFLKDIRAAWNESKFFMGKNAVMAKALGTSTEEEGKQNLHLLSQRLVGNVGLLLSNEAPEKVLSFFEAFAEVDYARAANIATETIAFPAGPVMRGEAPFPHTLESQARGLGFPCILKNGVVMLNGDFVLCEEGQQLSSEQARLLKLFDIKMAAFKIIVTCYYHDGQVYSIDRE